MTTSSSSSSSCTCGELIKSTKYDVYCSNFAIVCILLGVAVTLATFFYPVDWDYYQIDPKLSAQENEDRQAHQIQTQNNAYIMSITGVVLVTVGGIVSAFLLSKYILLQECVQTDDEEILTSQPFPFSYETGCQNMDWTGKKENKETALRDGQKRTLGDSDYLQLSGARPQYGSTE